MLFVINALDKPDGFALRAATRPAHVDYLNNLLPRITLAGPQLNAEGQAIGSLVIIEAEDQAAAESVAAQDPYALAGLFQTVAVTPYRMVFKDGAKAG